MHLNGSTELDILWPDVCATPEVLYEELAKAQKKNPEPSAELYEQSEAGLSSFEIYQRLRAVRRVRRQLALEIASDIFADQMNGLRGIGLSTFQEAAEFARSDEDWPCPQSFSLSLRPIEILFPRKSYRPIIDEAAFLYLCMNELRRDPDRGEIGIGLYFNFLALRQIAHIAVQQVDESGFDQFQKYTLIGTRERIEKYYTARFRQLNVKAPFHTLAYLEGRFAPKNDVATTRTLIAGIVKGYLEFRQCKNTKQASRMDSQPPPCLVGQSCGNNNCDERGRPDAEFSLVAHFIKRLPKPLNDSALRCRDSDLRLVLDKQARILKNLIQGNATVRALLRGIDGAANELHASPEPFAPAFRLVRRESIPRATFHVGEDFLHLLSGIRAVAEALMFLNLCSGDRIGHATAVGIDPTLWLTRTAPRAIMSRMDVLDNSVFAYRALAGIEGFAEELLRLERLIAIHSDILYGRECSPDVLHRAWELRCLDPLAMRKVEHNLQMNRKVVSAESIAEEATFMAAITVDVSLAVELQLIADTVERSGVACELFLQRHSLDPEHAGESVEIDAAIITPEAFVALQDHVLGLVNDRGVAIETLPTSNMRISYYDDMSEHHLYRWLGLCGPKLTNRPTVCVGSDDPGIFATNLKNEFEAIGSVLRHRFKLTSAEATRILEELNDNGRIYRFCPATPFPMEAKKY
jgi:hypothetical protein